MATLLAIAVLVKLVSPELVFWSLLSLLGMVSLKEWRSVTKRASLLFSWVGILVLGLWILSTAVLFRCHGWYPIGYAVMVAMMADSLAYGLGSCLGGPKLCPTISPNKTWSGFLGSLLLTPVFMGAFRYGCVLMGKEPVFPWGMDILVCLVAQLGDLTESWAKRRLDIKDMNTLLPGHGGVLDRIDSWIAALLVVSWAYGWVL